MLQESKIILKSTVSICWVDIMFKSNFHKGQRGAGALTSKICGKIKLPMQYDFLPRLQMQNFWIHILSICHSTVYILCEIVISVNFNLL